MHNCPIKLEYITLSCPSNSGLAQLVIIIHMSTLCCISYLCVAWLPGSLFLVWIMGPLAWIPFALRLVLPTTMMASNVGSRHGLVVSFLACPWVLLCALFRLVTVNSELPCHEVVVDDYTWRVVQLQRIWSVQAFHISPVRLVLKIGVVFSLACWLAFSAWFIFN